MPSGRSRPRQPSLTTASSSFCIPDSRLHLTFCRSTDRLPLNTKKNHKQRQAIRGGGPIGGHTGKDSRHQPNKTELTALSLYLSYEYEYVKRSNLYEVPDDRFCPYLFDEQIRAIPHTSINTKMTRECRKRGHLKTSVVVFPWIRVNQEGERFHCSRKNTSSSHVNDTDLVSDAFYDSGSLFR